MKSIQSMWVYNLSLRLAAIVCLGVLVAGLLFDVEPLTALLRGAVAFVVFILLGWAVATIWDITLPEFVEAAPAGESSAPPDQTDAKAAGTPVPDEVPARV